MSLYRTVSEINGDFRRKLQIFPTPVYYAPKLTGFPLESVRGGGSENYNDWVPR